MTANATVWNSVAVADPDAPTNVIKPNADGSINVSAAGYDFENITTSDTTLVKTGAGVLHGITVNTLGSAGAVVAYDSLTGSGTIIGSIDSETLSGQFLFDVAFGTGLTIVTTGAPDITVSYR